MGDSYEPPFFMLGGHSRVLATVEHKEGHQSSPRCSNCSRRAAFCEAVPQAGATTQIIKREYADHGRHILVLRMAYSLFLPHDAFSKQVGPCAHGLGPSIFWMDIKFYGSVDSIIDIRKQ